MTDPHSAPEALTQYLQDLHMEAGKPSSRSLADQSDYISHTTINQAVTGDRVPSWPKLKLIVGLLGGDAEEAYSLWEQCQVPKSPPRHKVSVAVKAATGGPWFVIVNDLVGGWSISTAPFPLSEGRGVCIADFMRREDAVFCAEAHNAFSSKVTPEEVRAARSGQIHIEADGTLALKPEPKPEITTEEPA